MTDYNPRPERRRRFVSPTELPGEPSPLAPGESAASPSADAPPSVTSLSDGGVWKEIDDFARSGARVFVRSFDGEETEAFISATRRYNPRAVKWEAYERWMRTDGLGTLNWKPVQYKALS